jgi:hypothetical protein
MWKLGYRHYLLKKSGTRPELHIPRTCAWPATVTRAMAPRRQPELSALTDSCLRRPLMDGNRHRA